MPLNINRSALVIHEAIGAGARPDENDTLAQVQHVSAALKASGWAVSVLEVDLDLTAVQREITQLKPTLVFNLVESLGGDGRLIHFVPTLLQSCRVPFTGSGADAIYLSSQKRLAKRLMRARGIATPADFGPGEAYFGDNTSWIVKSVWEHASLGLDDGCVVNSLPAARKRFRSCRAQHGGEWFAEEYIDGREFNLSLIEVNGRPELLPVAEMTFVDYPTGKPRIVGYAAKWDQTAPEYNATQRVFGKLSAPELNALRNVALHCWTVFDLKGYARVDIRMDKAGKPWVLEINANPCLTPDAGFVAAAIESGRSYKQLIDLITTATDRVI
ncbi:MAG: D-alanine--D-alanine ligase [Gammaproteobacteria bacterium]|nr:D-alanine--D-alanine ligase [Gammaproteobacteria bacterium]MDH5239534.1 D-alanine--D-alanine ligase [Gammaproteobacteria bacterium]MDH5261037.1 D-alanine--D-alanine ligase [Gammaproteobacteria bacterium]MDH5582757.1 D-alanine--D-alanine ligase [Gammaproteobacteria bacterium]